MKTLAVTLPDTIPLNKLKVWVLAPHLESDDPNIQCYYDFTQSLQEYTKVFNDLNIEWVWQPVTMQNYKEVLASIKSNSEGKSPLVLNLCDGDEINGTPGISVIHELDNLGLIYTGSAASYYNITTSKIPMKTAFDAHNVSTPGWDVVTNKDQSFEQLFDRLGSPLIIKPAISGGSMGVSVNNVVHNAEELKSQVDHLSNGYRGWELATGGLFVEQFIQGPEFTTFIVGSASQPDKCIVYEPVERVFHSSLPETEKFLSFDRLWEIYEKESPMPNGDNFYQYFPPDPKLVDAIKKISLDAYCAVGATGYGRLDIRMDATTGKLYMLEVNAQCGLSEDEDYTSIGAILRVSGKTFTQLVLEIIRDAFIRRLYE